MGLFRVVPFNVRGMKMAERRTAVFFSVKELHYDVLFLQECHMENDKDVNFQISGPWDRPFREWRM